MFYADIGKAPCVSGAFANRKWKISGGLRRHPIISKDRFISKPDLALFRSLASGMNYCSAI